MKKLVLLLGLVFSVQASAAVLFEDDFETDLSAWTGTGGGGHNGAIVNDPLIAGNHVLNFTALNSAGDIFTDDDYQSASNMYVLSYDYLGTCSTGDCGGYIGYSYGLPGSHVWLGGSGTASGASDVNADTGQWVHVVIPFTATQAQAIHVMIEDFSGSGGTSGDAYFDNVRLESVGVPEPASLGLLGLALAALGVGARRRMRSE